MSALASFLHIFLLRQSGSSYEGEKEMRWEKGEDFVEIASAVSEAHGAVWHVESSLEFKDLPVEFRGQVPTANKEDYENLERSVSSWAEREGFQLVD